jgi:thiol-disulfide isomerase/thioredoxin
VAQEDPSEFCDVYHEPSTAPHFEYPEFEGPPPTAGNKGWRWINIWATWCKPCVEELPRLAKWSGQLPGVGDLVLISSDETAEAVAKFRKAHPDAPPTMRLRDPASLTPWLESLGLPKESALPIHIFVDESGGVRCLRAGGVSESEYGAVERLVGP